MCMNEIYSKSRHNTLKQYKEYFNSSRFLLVLFIFVIVIRDILQLTNKVHIGPKDALIHLWCPPSSTTIGSDWTKDTQKKRQCNSFSSQFNNNIPAHLTAKGNLQSSQARKKTMLLTAQHS